MEHSHEHKTCCEQAASRYNVCQTIDEISFERGIWTAALEGDVDRVSKLLRKGVLADVADSAGYTALHYATRSGHIRVCEILLGHGAQVNSCTRSIRATPLHRAAAMGHVEIVDLLLRHGAASNLTDVDGRTALHQAIPMLSGSAEGIEIVKKLLPITDRTIKDKHGRTVDDVFEHWRTTESDATTLSSSSSSPSSPLPPPPLLARRSLLRVYVHARFAPFRTKSSAFPSRRSAIGDLAARVTIGRRAAM